MAINCRKNIMLTLVTITKYNCKSSQIVLCSAVHCHVLQNTALSILYYTAVHCSVDRALQCSAVHYTVGAHVN